MNNDITYETTIKRDDLEDLIDKHYTDSEITSFIIRLLEAREHTKFPEKLIATLELWLSG